MILDSLGNSTGLSSFIKVVKRLRRPVLIGIHQKCQSERDLHILKRKEGGAFRGRILFFNQKGHYVRTDILQIFRPLHGSRFTLKKGYGVQETFGRGLLKNNFLTVSNSHSKPPG
jgi:hypothetical protein